VVRESEAFSSLLEIRDFQLAAETRRVSATSQNGFAVLNDCARSLRGQQKPVPRSEAFVATAGPKVPPSQQKRSLTVSDGSLAAELLVPHRSLARVIVASAQG